MKIAGLRAIDASSKCATVLSPNSTADAMHQCPLSHALQQGIRIMLSNSVRSRRKLRLARSAPRPSRVPAGAVSASILTRQNDHIVLKPERDFRQRKVRERDGLAGHHSVVAVLAGEHGTS